MDNEATKLREVKLVVGQDRFRIQTDLSDEELSAISDFVSKKTEQYLGDKNIADPRKQLILMALDITSEYFDVRKKFIHLYENNKKAEKEIVVLNQILDSAEF